VIVAVRQRIVPVVLQQHVEDAAILYATRTALAAGPHVQLHHLRRFDDRIAAHLDGISIAGEAARPMCDAALELASPGAVFVAANCALQSRDVDWLRRLLVLCEAESLCRGGLIGAFEWTPREQLQGIVATLLNSTQRVERFIALAACARHRVDPGLGAAKRLEDPDALVRARAYRAAGELGKREFLSRLGANNEQEPLCRFWAAWAAVLLGDRHRALDDLTAISVADGPLRSTGRQLMLAAMQPDQGREYLRGLATDPAQIRALLRGAGIVGDPAYVPWLMRHMSDDKLACLAGESFSLITGADLALLDLERKPPQQVESGPNDDPDDANVEMDEDESLPWPDVERIERWWAQNSSRFVPGRRFFVGAPVTREHCIDVLRTGYQRQRILAAHHLCLLEPGSVLFEWRAPAWRQSQALAALV
jgi:uncharacterized protein (TIGR02270 family)